MHRHNDRAHDGCCDEGEKTVPRADSWSWGGMVQASVPRGSDASRKS